ncbi:uncharacterized protein A4U43_C05F34020 [Asparagus officinalis]|uniref:Uncharacterized protein n=1 Tax=Asparagus officinalis TaxID=4686 RepID=A0A5P1EZ81_ASPOF|nr:uncharacterized protein A4U43_C05F34020 [Asparagus officinalis]
MRDRPEVPPPGVATLQVFMARCEVPAILLRPACSGGRSPISGACEPKVKDASGEPATPRRAAGRADDEAQPGPRLPLRPGALAREPLSAELRNSSLRACQGSRRGGQSGAPHRASPGGRGERESKEKLQVRPPDVRAEAGKRATAWRLVRGSKKDGEPEQRALRQRRIASQICPPPRDRTGRTAKEEERSGRRPRPQSELRRRGAERKKNRRVCAHIPAAAQGNGGKRGALRGDEQEAKVQ